MQVKRQFALRIISVSILVILVFGLILNNLLTYSFWIDEGYSAWLVRDEVRDPETISMAMTAAETGHLVLGTLHTTSATKTIDRIVDALPAEQREQTKSFLAQSLQAVVTQILVKAHEGQGRKAIVEVMLTTRAIAKCIMSDQTHQIPSQLQTGRDIGMQLMDQALLQAIQAKEVDPDDAYNYAIDKKRFQRFITDTGLLPKIDLVE